MNDWHGRVQRGHHLTRGLVRLGYRNVYLNPHLGREFRELPGRGAPVRLTDLEPGVHELHVRLPREPVFHHRLLRDEESAAISDAALSVLQSIGAKRSTIILSFPLWLAAAERIRERAGAKLIYDCHDYLPGFDAVAPAIIAEELRLFQAADAVICSSETLLLRARSCVRPNTRCALIRNAAFPGFLSTERRNNGGQVTIGYAGALESWFDVEAIRTAARARPEWRFLLVGRVDDRRIRELGALENLELAGEVPFARLGEFLSRFTVATIPFALNPLTEATDPIKIYEYFAAGLPVVASDMPELRRFGGLIERYRGPADFAAALERAITNDTPDASRQRRAIAEKESWTARAEALADEIRLCSEPE